MSNHISNMPQMLKQTGQTNEGNVSFLFCKLINATRTGNSRPMEVYWYNFPYKIRFDTPRVKTCRIIYISLMKIWLSHWCGGQSPRIHIQQHGINKESQWNWLLILEFSHRFCLLEWSSCCWRNDRSMMIDLYSSIFTTGGSSAMSYVSFPVDLIFSSFQTFAKFVWGMFNTWTVF